MKAETVKPGSLSKPRRLLALYQHYYSPTHPRKTERRKVTYADLPNPYSG